MKADINIPPEALEAAQRDAAVAIHRVVEPDTRAHELTEDEVADIARAACLAMLRAWPGMSVFPGMQTGTRETEASIILPIPKEPKA